MSASPAAQAASRPHAPLAVVTVDGPVGVGKSVIAKRLAARLGWTALDTGAMYRAAAYKALSAGVAVADATAMAQVAQSLDLAFEPDAASGERVRLDGQDVTRELRSPEVSAATAVAARHEDVRRAMVARQRRMGEQGRVVAEGRDMGTVVFPDAAVKFYLTGSTAERCRRRQLQMESQGQSAGETLMQELIQRDALDRRRPSGSLRVSADALVIDSTAFGEEFVLDLMARLAQRTLGEVQA